MKEQSNKFLMVLEERNKNHLLRGVKTFIFAAFPVVTVRKANGTNMNRQKRNIKTFSQIPLKMTLIQLMDLQDTVTQCIINCVREVMHIDHLWMGLFVHPEDDEAGELNFF